MSNSGNPHEELEAWEDSVSPDNYISVCTDHIEDRALSEWVRLSLTEDECTVCGKQSDTPVAVDMDSLAELIRTAISRDYVPAEEEGLPPAEDWPIPRSDMYELVGEYCAGAIDDGLIPAVQNRLDLSSEMVSVDWMSGQSEDEKLMASWRTFCMIVKHRARFWFLAGEDDAYDEELSPERLLHQLGEMLDSTAECIVSWPAGSTLFRGRMVDAEKEANTYSAKNLGPPPVERTRTNRMSPAGISMFYGSDSPETVVAEIGIHSTKSHAIVGEFITMRELRVMDMTALPLVPSVFDSEDRRYRRQVMFLRDFADLIAEPVELDGREHIDYVPTQVVTEYFRLAARKRVDGIRFRSAQCSGSSTVLFCQPSEVVDEDQREKDSPWLILRKQRIKMLRVVSAIAS